MVTARWPRAWPAPRRRFCYRPSCWRSWTTCSRAGSDGQRASRIKLLSEVERGAYQLQPFLGTDVREALGFIEQHADLGISLADASIAVLATRHGVQEVLTLDERHFRVLTVNGKAFRLLPADARG